MAWTWLMAMLNSLPALPELWFAMGSFLCFRHYLKNKNSPICKWPLAGMLPSLLLNAHRLHDWITEVLQISNGTIVFTGPSFSNMEIVTTCDPANTEHILKTNFSNFPKGHEFVEIFDVLGDGIFNSDSDSWSLQRQMALTHLRYSEFRRFTVRASEETVEKQLIPVLKSVAEHGQIVDLQEVLLRAMFDIACVLIFGKNPRFLSADFPTNPFAKALDEVEEILILRHTVPQSWWKLQRWFNVGTEKKFAEASKTINRFISHYISIKKEELATLKIHEREQPKDLLTFYMESEPDTDLGLLNSDKFLRDTALNFMIAGRDTTAVALTWFFWLVSQNPRVETKILEELQQNSAKIRNGVFYSEDLRGLVYLHAAICESLRLYPSVPINHKEVLSTDVLPTGEIVRPGMRIYYSVYAMGRMEWIWGRDCLEFKPERWITEKGSVRFEATHKFLAFNAGPRTCLGKDMALTQMKAVAAGVLGKFHVEAVEGHRVYPKTSLLLLMEKGLRVRVRERERG